jgi:GDP-L-fucose synthase|tara:strand:+ start:530 stop:1453 length:924 start_codon:yes stop_codon:yes gene_type:complete
MNVIITGGSGFIGRALSAKLKKITHNVITLSSRDANLLDSNSLDVYNNIKFDKIYHLAAWTQAGDWCLYHSGDQWLLNQQINTTVLSWWKNFQSQAKLISIGTNFCYDENKALIETNYLKGNPRQDLYCYSMTKRMLLIGQMSLNKQYGFNYLTVIPPAVYGPGYRMDNEKQNHFIYDLILKILDHKYTGKEIVLWGDGNQKREIIYIDDLIKKILLLDEIVDNEVVNLGTGEDLTIKEFAAMICNIVGVRPEIIKYDETKFVGARNKLLDIDKLKKVIPNLDNVSLLKGITLTIEWVEKYYKSAVR